MYILLLLNFVLLCDSICDDSDLLYNILVNLYFIFICMHVFYSKIVSNSAIGCES